MASDVKKKIRLIVTVIIVALILAGAGTFILKDKNGRPFISAEDRAYTEMYKYKDANGILHYTDIKPENTEYEVIYMPVSKDKQTIGKTVEGFIGKVLNDKKKEKKEEELPKNSSADERASGHVNVLKGVKQTLETVADQYKGAPEALNDAKKLKEQVEKIYQDRDKAMREMKQ